LVAAVPEVQRAAEYFRKNKRIF
ncbi:hypothetical protein EVA_08920, partial [gut metagenome]